MAHIPFERFFDKDYQKKEEFKKHLEECRECRRIHEMLRLMDFSKEEISFYSPPESLIEKAIKMGKRRKLVTVFKNFSKAVQNTFWGVKETLNNKELWIGFTLSVFLHFAILLFGFLKPPEKEETKYLTIEFYDERYSPKAVKIIQREAPFIPEKISKKEVASLTLRKREVRFQAPFSVEEISLEEKKPFKREILKIALSKQISTEEILAQAPVMEKEREMGRGFSSQTPIELSEKRLEMTPARIKAKEISKKALKEYKKRKFVLEGEVTEKDIVSKYMPLYPSWARKRYITARCKISFRVDEKGNVLAVMEILESTGYPAWDEEIKKTLLKWKFREGEGIRRAVITFIFILQ